MRKSSSSAVGGSRVRLGLCADAVGRGVEEVGCFEITKEVDYADNNGSGSARVV